MPTFFFSDLLNLRIPIEPSHANTSDLTFMLIGPGPKKKPFQSGVHLLELGVVLMEIFYSFYHGTHHHFAPPFGRIFVYFFQST